MWPISKTAKGQRGKQKGQGWSSDNSFLFISFTGVHNSTENVNLNYVEIEKNSHGKKGIEQGAYYYPLFSF